MRAKGSAKGRYVSLGDLGAKVPASGKAAAQPEDGIVPEPSPDAEKRSHGIPGTFSLLYESKDGRLCTFEDTDGHLTSVDSSRFA